MDKRVINALIYLISGIVTSTLLVVSIVFSYSFNIYLCGVLIFLTLFIEAFLFSQAYLNYMRYKNVRFRRKDFKVYKYRSLKDINNVLKPLELQEEDGYKIYLKERDSLNFIVVNDSKSEIEISNFAFRVRNAYDVRKLVVIVEEDKPLYINHLRNVGMNIICLQKTKEGYLINIDESCLMKKRVLIDEIKEELGLVKID